MSEHIRIRTSSSIEINRLVALLDQNNIPSLIKDNVESARAAGFGISQNSVDLYVNDSDFERAQKLIEEFHHENASEK